MPRRIPKRVQPAAATWSGSSALNWVGEGLSLASILEKSETLYKAFADWQSLPSLPTAALVDQARLDLEQALDFRNLNRDEFDPLTLEKLRELIWALSVPADLTLALLHDVITLLRCVVQPVRRSLGAPPQYCPEARKYGRKLRDENRGMFWDDIRAQTKEQFPQARLPRGKKKFRDWITSLKKGD
jgi:hypothetical protein